MKTTIHSKRHLAMMLELLPLGRGTIGNIFLSLQKSYQIWDPWILKDGDLYRLFYLATPKLPSSVPFWSQGTIYGAVSTDMQNWQSIGVVLEPTLDNLWESGRMLAGCTYKEDGVYYLFYSSSGKGEQFGLGDERINLATSTDGINWQRCLNNPLFSEDEWSQWYGKSSLINNHFHWRDPYIVKDHKSGKYYMFICTYLQRGAPHKYRGCIGLAVSDSIKGPYKLLPPATAPTDDEIEDYPFPEMERPQVIYKYGKYHLFFSCWPRYINPKWKEKIDLRRITGSSIYHFVSDNISGPFKPASDMPIVKGSEKTGLYGTNFFPAPDNPTELVACGWYHRLLTLEVSPLFKVVWSNNSIEIRDKRWLSVATAIKFCQEVGRSKVPLSSQ